jgi:hypothetical protein
MGHIEIAYRCELTSDGLWVPAFELSLVEDGQIRILPPLFAADPDLTFRTKEQAEAYSDAAARDWCAKNYPGWPVQPI